jgi:hypothetical protein
LPLAELDFLAIASQAAEKERERRCGANGTPNVKTHKN